MNNLLVKYADDITISVPVRQSTDTAAAEVENMMKWMDTNEMSLNFTKTWEMCMHGKSTKLSPPVLPGLKRKSWLKLLGVTFQEDATYRDIHIDNMMLSLPDHRVNSESESNPSPSQIRVRVK